MGFIFRKSMLLVSPLLLDSHFNHRILDQAAGLRLVVEGTLGSYSPLCAETDLASRTV